jgi:hypothetical protein
MESRSVIVRLKRGIARAELRFGKSGKGFTINKAGRVRWTLPGFAARGASLSGGLSSFRVSKAAACTRSLFRPCPGRRVEKPRRFSSKASTEAAVSSRWSSAADRTLSDLPFSGAGGRPEVAKTRLVACQCVSLAFHSGGWSQQLAAVWGRSEKMSVRRVTVVRACGQPNFAQGFVLPITGRRAASGGC